MHMRICTQLAGFVFVCWLCVCPRAAAAEDVAPLVARIKAVGKEGAGNADAARAWKDLSRQGPGALIDILAALDDAGPVAANWLRSAVDAIAEKTLDSGKSLPAEKLEAFVRDTHHGGPGRRLAYDWLTRVDASAPERLLPGMLSDRGAELRRDAVAVVLNEAQKQLDKKDKGAARAAYQKALHFARERDQVTLAVDQLKKLGTDIDITAQFGFVTKWMIVGPFDNVGGKGFNTVFPPERGVDLKASYAGKDGKPLRWSEHATTLPLGMVDFNKIIGALHGTTAFAYTVVETPGTRPVELRAGSNNALRIYLNGKEVFFREEYHHGSRMDQHVARGILKAGRNEILVKVCQNEQTDSWAQQWSFQLRVCDDIGGAVPITVVTNKQ
jgi:hypothetical protein